MAAEVAKDPGNDKGHGSEHGGLNTVQGAFLLIHNVLGDTAIALEFPSTDAENPATIFVLHSPGDEYTFVEKFEDKAKHPNLYGVEVEDGKVLLSAKWVPTREQFDQYGPQTAARVMAWQDASGLSVPGKEEQRDFTRVFGDYLKAMQDKTYTHLDFSALKADAA